MAENLLEPELRFRPEGVTEKEFFKESEKVFQAAIASSRELRERKHYLMRIFKEVQRVYITNPEVNKKAREALFLGLTVARLEEKGKKERAEQQKGLLLKRCQELYDLFLVHLPGKIDIFPSVYELMEAAIQIALAIQKSKEIQKLRREKTGKIAGRREVSPVSIERSIGRAVGKWVENLKRDLESGCLVGLAIFLAIAISWGTLVDQLAFGGRYRRALTGERIAGATRQESEKIINLAEEDFPRLEYLLKFPDKGLELYFQEVWGISPDDLDQWRQAHPGASEDEIREFADEVFRGKTPIFTGGYLKWAEEKRIQRPPERPPESTPTPQGRLLEKGGRSKIAAHPYIYGRGRRKGI